MRETRTRPSTSLSIGSFKSSIEIIESVCGKTCQTELKIDHKKRSYLARVASACSNKAFFVRDNLIKSKSFSIKERPKTTKPKACFNKAENDDNSLDKERVNTALSADEFNSAPKNHRLNKHFIVELNDNFESQVVESTIKLEIDTQIYQKSNDYDYSKPFFVDTTQEQSCFGNFLSQQFDYYNLDSIKKSTNSSSMKPRKICNTNEFSKLTNESFDIENESRLLLSSTEYILSKSKSTRGGKKFINWAKRGKLLAIIRFRKAVRLVQLILQSVSRIQSNTHKNTTDNDILLSSRIYKDDLIFDVSNFKRPKEIALTNEAIRIMRCAISERTDEQIRVAIASLIQTSPEYADFPSKVQRLIVKYCNYDEYETGRVVIRQGHRADNFYFMVSGLCAVTVSDRKVNTGEPYQRIVAYLKKGNTFGELAIMHQSTRNATVTCHSKVSVLSLNRDDFVSIFMPIENGQEPEHITYLRDIELLKEFPIDKLPYSNPQVCLITYFRRGLLMCKDSNKNEWLYVIKSGSCKIIKELQIPLKTKNQTTPRKNQVSHESFYEKHMNSTPTNEIKKQREIHREEIFKQKSNKVFIDIQQLLPKDIFGLVQLIYGPISKSTSVTLVSEGAECILIKKNFFQKFMNDKLHNVLSKATWPYPSEKELQDKLETNTNWSHFKGETIKNYYEYKKKCEYFNLFI